jgi:predicted PurR-regulated permease PerM
VGAFVGCIFGAFFIFVQNPMLAVGFVIMFLVLQQIENNLIYPRVVGTSIGLSGMWVLLAVAVGGEFFGVAGMFRMIPMASVLYTLLREFAQKRLGQRNIAPEKLVPQPPELRWHFKEKRKKFAEKRNKARMAANEQNTDEEQTGEQ